LQGYPQQYKEKQLSPFVGRKGGRKEGRKKRRKEEKEKERNEERKKRKTARKKEQEKLARPRYRKTLASSKGPYKEFVSLLSVMSLWQVPNLSFSSFFQRMVKKKSL
jgi:hypothetical protein